MPLENYAMHPSRNASRSFHIRSWFQWK